MYALKRYKCIIRKKTVHLSEYLNKTNKKIKMLSIFNILFEKKMKLVLGSKR